MVETRCAGDVTLQEVLEHFRTLAFDPALPKQVDVLLDLSETTSVPETVRLHGVVGELERLRGRLQVGACAIVAASDALFGMSRMFAVFTEPYFARTRVFRDRVEAERWLASTRAVRGGFPGG